MRLISVRLSILLLATLSPTLLAFSFVDETKKPGGPVSRKVYPRLWIRSASKDWMKYLPNDSDLATISIPGTHDTMAFVGAFYCVTQVWSLAEQLAAGIRYLDIRNRRAGNVFTIHHGICFLDAEFDDVMDEVRKFLDEHPSETIVMRVKEEHVPQQNSLSFQDIWDRYMPEYGSLFVPDQGSSIPKLGDIRGKVLVLRNADFVGYGLQYDDPAVMGIQDAFRVYRSSKKNPFGPGTVSVLEKRRLIRKYLAKSLSSSKLILNHLSGSTGLFPIDVAKRTNPTAYKKMGPWDGKEPRGVVIMDYPGERLVFRVIKTNFPMEPSTTL